MSSNETLTDDASPSNDTNKSYESAIDDQEDESSACLIVHMSDKTNDDITVSSSRFVTNECRRSLDNPSSSNQVSELQNEGPASITASVADDTTEEQVVGKGASDAKKKSRKWRSPQHFHDPHAAYLHYVKALHNNDNLQQMIQSVPFPMIVTSVLIVFFLCVLLTECKTSLVGANQASQMGLASGSDARTLSSSSMVQSYVMNSENSDGSEGEHRSHQVVVGRNEIPMPLTRPGFLLDEKTLDQQQQQQVEGNQQRASELELIRRLSLIDQLDETDQRSAKLAGERRQATKQLFLLSNSQPSRSLDQLNNDRPQELQVQRQRLLKLEQVESNPESQARSESDPERSPKSVNSHLIGREGPSLANHNGGNQGGMQPNRHLEAKRHTLGSMLLGSGSKPLESLALVSPSGSGNEDPQEHGTGVESENGAAVEDIYLDGGLQPAHLRSSALELNMDETQTSGHNNNRYPNNIHRSSGSTSNGEHHRYLKQQHYNQHQPSSSPPPLTQQQQHIHQLFSYNHDRPYDVAQVQCNSTEEGFERFACPTPDVYGRYRCIEDRLFCDGYLDCPGGEDEERSSCMYYRLKQNRQNNMHKFDNPRVAVQE